MSPRSPAWFLVALVVGAAAVALLDQRSQLNRLEGKVLELQSRLATAEAGLGAARERQKELTLEYERRPELTELVRLRAELAHLQQIEREIQTLRTALAQAQPAPPVRTNQVANQVPAAPGSLLPVRHFQVDTAVFVEGVQSILQQSRLLANEVQATTGTNDAPGLLWNYLRFCGVTLPSPVPINPAAGPLGEPASDDVALPSRGLLFEPRTGSLLVRAEAPELDAVEQALNALKAVVTPKSPVP